MRNKALGDLGEALAADYLVESGMYILERKYRAFAGEIDIIAKDGSYLVFVEVKTRRTQSYGTPAQAVNYVKRTKIIQTARAYLYRHHLEDKSCRFDVVEVYYNGAHNIKINHIKNAFIE